MSQSQTNYEDGWAVIPRWVLRGGYFEAETQKLLYIALVDRRDVYGYCQPSPLMLAQDATISPGAVIKNIKRLKEIGLISVRRHAAEGDGYLSDEYYVSLYPTGKQEGL